MCPTFKSLATAVIFKRVLFKMVNAVVLPYIVYDPLLETSFWLKRNINGGGRDPKERSGFLCTIQCHPETGTSLGLQYRKFVNNWKCRLQYYTVYLQYYTLYVCLVGNEKGLGSMFWQSFLQDIMSSFINPICVGYIPYNTSLTWQDQSEGTFLLQL